MDSLQSAPDAPATVTPEPIRRRRWRHRLLIASPLLAIMLAPLAVTYVQELRKPGYASTEARTVQWARDWHLGPIVDWAERRQYSSDQFALGGVPPADALAAIPTTTTTSTTAPQATTTSTSPPRLHLDPPRPLTSPAATPLPSEGQWAPTGPMINGFPGVYTAVVRPDNEHTSLLVFAAWIDPNLTTIELHPGSDVPGGTWSAPNSIPTDRCADLIFAGNGGFRMDQSRGGFYLDGNAGVPLKDGAASLVFYKDGSVDVGTWGADMGNGDLPQIASVRQNLELLVDHGQPSVNIDSTNWGALLKSSALVWRSAWGVTKDGALIYVGGPALSIPNLTRILIDAGAERAMEGDINPSWVTGNTYTVDDTGACHGTPGLPQSRADGGMHQPGDRYLTQDTRDFIAVLADPRVGQ
jgi:hypothetical protein